MSTPTPTPYFQAHMKILRICGISLETKDKITYKLYSYFMIFIIVTYAILDIYELFKHDFETSSGIVLYVLYGLMTITKATSLLINRLKVKGLLDKLKQKPFIADPNRGGKEEEILISECVWFTSLQGYMYGSLNVVGVTGYTLYALSTRLRSNDYHKWRFVFGTLTFLDITKSRNYTITFVYQYICSIIYAGIYVTTDIIVMGVLTHISYQFRVLQNYLRNIVAYTHRDMLKMQESSTTASDSKYLQKSIKRAIKYHVAILDLAKEADESFRYMFLITFLITIGFLCFETYELSFFAESSFNNISQHIIEYSNNAFQVLAVCYWGEQMLLQSTEVANAAFDSDFVGTDKSVQKALAMVIQKSQNPVKLSAGKFADISLATSVWVVKTSYTMWMVLRNTNET